MRWRGSMLVLLVASVAWGRETTTPSLTVVVRENNSSGRPLEGVQVTAPGASPAVTIANGTTQLLIPGHEPGDDLEVAIYKEGYEVVNDLERNVTLPRKQELHLFLCKPTRCLAERLSFYRLSTDRLRTEIEARYLKSLNELAAKGHEIAKELGRVESERDQASATVNRLTEELAQLKPGERSASYRREAQLFTEGKLEEALQELDAAELDQAHHQARSQLEDVARRYILRGQILAARFQFSEAEVAFEKAVETVPQFIEAMLAKAHFLADQNKNGAAIEAYTSSLDRAYVLKEWPLVAAIHNNRGGLYHKQKKSMSDAQTDFETALTILRMLAAKDPDFYLPKVATTLNNLGVLYREQKQLTEAQDAFLKALGILADLPCQDRETYIEEVARANNNLGILYRDQGKMDDAQKAFGYALAIIRNLAGKKPEDYQLRLATTLNNFGVLFHKQGQFNDARKAFEEALEILRSQANKKPNCCLPDIATTLCNLGGVHNDQGRFADTRIAFAEALEILNNLGKNNPQVYLPAAATTLEQFRKLLYDRSRIDDEQKALEDLLKIYRKLADNDPESYLPVLATTFNALAHLHHTQGRMADAQWGYEEALTIYQKMAKAKNNFKSYLPEVANTLADIGRLQRAQERLDEAQKAHEDALHTFCQLADKDPAYLPAVATTHSSLGLLHIEGKRLDEALKAYEAALKIYRQLAESSPQVHLPNVATTLQNLGALYSAQARIHGAQMAYEEQLATYRKLAGENPKIYLPSVATSLNTLGNLHREQMRVEEAQRYYEERIQILQLLPSMNPEGSLPLLAEGLQSLGEFEMVNSNFGKASELLARALDTLKKSVLPGHPQEATAVGRLSGLLARSYFLAGKTEEAVMEAQEAISLMLIGALVPGEQKAFDPMIQELHQILSAAPVQAPLALEPPTDLQDDCQAPEPDGGFMPPISELYPLMNIIAWSRNSSYGET